MRALFALLLLLLPGLAPAAEPFEPKAPVAYVYDLTAGIVLLAKEADRPVEPASMAKLMTAKVVFDALAAGEITTATEYAVGEDAWRRGGAPSGTATMFAALKSRVSVADLLRGLAVQNANDACLILAEGLAGGEAAFVERMNAGAVALGLGATRFRNATGFAAEGQLTTARDLARLARHLVVDHRERYRLFGEAEFTWNKIRQRNRNPLIPSVAGADGLLTGSSDTAGFGLVASVEREGRRIIIVLHGLASSEDRAAEARRVVEWAFSAFASRPLFAAGEPIGRASVYGGDTWSVPLVARAPVVAVVRTDVVEALEAEIVYRGPLVAPVAAGETVATLRVRRAGELSFEVPLVTAGAVGRGSLTQNAFGAVLEVVAGLWHRLWTRA